MNLYHDGNFSSIERSLRFLVSLNLIAAVVLLVLPSWVALIAVYPFTTALIAWDPMYAVIQSLQFRSGQKDVMLELAEEN